MTKSVTITLPSIEAFNEALRLIAELRYELEQVKANQAKVMTETKWISIPDAAKILGMSPATLKREIEGDLECEQKGATFVLNENVKRYSNGRIYVAESFCKSWVSLGDSSVLRKAI